MNLIINLVFSFFHSHLSMSEKMFKNSPKMFLYLNFVIKMHGAKS